MTKFCKIIFGLALVISFSNFAHAEEFDPIAELANSDALLGLDLPSDLNSENFSPEEVPASVESTADTIANSAATTKNGGALAPENSAPQFVAPTPSSLFDSGIVKYDYGAARTDAQLAPTGPADALALAFLTAVGGAVLFHFRKKLGHVFKN